MTDPILKAGSLRCLECRVYTGGGDMCVSCELKLPASGRVIDDPAALRDYLVRLAWEAYSDTANIRPGEYTREALERRVSLLKPDSLDLDILDERVRATINLGLPNEVVIAQPTAAR